MELGKKRAEARARVRRYDRRMEALKAAGAVATVRILLALTGVLAAFGLPQVAAAQVPQPASQASAASVRATLDRFCVRCHNDRLRTADLALDTRALADVGADAEVWERVIVKLRSRTMPPAGSPRPAEATYRATASWLETAIDTVALASPDPGRGETFHRLNRAEYHAAVRDLLAVDVDVAELLPADDTYEHGFDNNGDVLSISPDLVARYLSAARRISRLAVGIPPVGPAVATYRVHPGLLQDDRQDDLLSFGSRGGIAIRHHFPVDGEYSIRIRLHRNFSDYILGFAAPQELDVRVDGALVERFAVGDADSVGQMAPLSFAGNIAGDAEWEYYMNTGDSHLEARFHAKAGQRTVGVSFVRRASEPEGVLQPRNRGYGRFVDERYDDQAAVEQVAIGGPYTVEGPGDTPSRRAIFVCRPAADTAVAEESGADVTAAQEAGADTTVAQEAGTDAAVAEEPAGTTLGKELAAGTTVAQGPRADTAVAKESTAGCRGRRRGSLRRPDPRQAGPTGVPAARRRWGRRGAARLLPRGDGARATSTPASSLRSNGCWSTPSSCSASSATRKTPRRARPTGSATWRWRRGSRSSCGAASRTTSCSRPRPAGGSATRRSWSGRPGGSLPTPARGPSSTTSRASGCACATWSRRNANRPTTRSSTRTCGRRSAARPSCSSRAPSARTAASWSCSTRNYTFVNERLARHYGIRGVYGDRFRRVPLDPDHPRGGLLGHGGLLMVTSYPNRTSPVVRGKWLLETILGAPPPEPPPNVPGLPDRGEAGEPASVRDRLERHRANPACAGCHAPMDPLGFALENFDAIGLWRATSEAGQPIDASATMPSGEAVRGTGGPAARAAEPGRGFRRHRHREAACLRAGARAGVHRPPRRAPDPARRGGRRLPLVVNRARHRREHAVPVAAVAGRRAAAGCRGGWPVTALDGQEAAP